MNVSLTPELDELVNEKVRIGLYQTASEVIRDTLRLLKQRDDEALRAYQRVGLTEVGPEGHGDGAPAVAVGNADGVDRIDRTSLTIGGRVARADRKAAVIPYRVRRDRLEVALVTTSGGKRWIVPKGWVDEGERPRDAAIREAEEEAGLRGVVARKPLGRYLHVNGSGSCRVDVYLMRVTDVLDHWGEAKFRRRRWMPVSDAAACVRDELREFVHGIEHLVGEHS